MARNAIGESELRTMLQDHQRTRRRHCRRRAAAPVGAGRALPAVPRRPGPFHAAGCGTAGDLRCTRSTARSATSTRPSNVFWSSYWTAPFCSYPDRTRDLTSVIKMSDFATSTALRRTELWSDYFRLFGVHREMMVCLPSPPRRSLRLLLSRGPGPDFSERDRGLLALLRPHLDARFQEWQRRRHPVHPHVAAA